VPESVQAIKGGAVDFLEKPFSQAILIERLEAACAQIRESRQRTADARARLARIDRLTPREREIVDHIVAHPSEISSKAIAARLGVSPRTVDHHRARILEKLGASSLVEVLAMATR
jgi:FixJ family two-component response regulator